MGLRSVTDPEGVRWDVWDTVPTIRPGLVQTALTRGWLTFQSAEGKRRLAPIPPEWESAPEHVILAYLARAVPAPPSEPRWAAS